MKNLIAYTLFSLVLLSSCNVEQANDVPQARECDSTHSLVGESRNIVDRGYGISGTITIVSDCEIEISNFNYNGAGPNVSIYGGEDGDFGRGVGVNMSDPINGQNFSGSTLNYFLPEGATFDEINSFSVWCFQFDVDFASAEF